MSFTVRQRSPRVKNGYLDEQPEISEFSPRTRLETSHIPLNIYRDTSLIAIANVVDAHCFIGDNRSSECN